MKVRVLGLDAKHVWQSLRPGCGQRIDLRCAVGDSAAQYELVVEQAFQGAPRQAVGLTRVRPAKGTDHTRDENTLVPTV